MTWYQKWFGKTYHWLYANRSDAEAEAQIDSICKLLKIHSKTRVLDIACGRGRHSIALAKRRIPVEGIDLSRESLAIASRDAARAGVAELAQFYEADMRALPFEDGAFDLLLSLFTSFGYFETDHEHLELLREWNRVLVPQGVLLLDLPNRERVIKQLVPHSEEFRDGKRIVQTRTLSADKKRLEKSIGIMCGEEFENFHESIRLFSLDEIERLLALAAFSSLQILADFDGTPFSTESERLIILAQK